MGRGGFPPSETGSFSAHHTATWVGFFDLVVSLQPSVLRKSKIALMEDFRFPARLFPGFHRI
jgi:hypothetical protein